MCKHQKEVYKMLFLNICTKILYKKKSSYSWGFFAVMWNLRKYRKIYISVLVIIQELISKLKDILNVQNFFFSVLVEVFCTFRIFTSLVFTWYQMVKIIIAECSKEGERKICILIWKW